MILKIIEEKKATIEGLKAKVEEKHFEKVDNENQKENSVESIKAANERGMFMSGFKSHNKQLTGNFLSPIWLKSLVVKLADNSTHQTKFESNRS